MKKLSVVLPFTGFYNNVLYEDVDPDQWKEFKKEFLPRYVRGVGAFLSDFCGSHFVELTPDEIDSPREYNFATDRIFAWISEEDARRLYRLADDACLREVVKRLFSSRDGFISYYDQDLSEWPDDPEDWDHNQLYALILSITEEMGYSTEFLFEEEIVQNEYIYELVSYYSSHCSESCSLEEKGDEDL